jgi:hypothetical protein
MSEIENLRLKYLGKSPALLLNDFPKRVIRILFPNMAYTQNYCKDRVNVIVIDGIITKIWLG